MFKLLDKAWAINNNKAKSMYVTQIKTMANLPGRRPIISYYLDSDAVTMNCAPVGVVSRGYGQEYDSSEVFSTKQELIDSLQRG